MERIKLQTIPTKPRSKKGTRQFISRFFSTPSDQRHLSSPVRKSPAAAAAAEQRDFHDAAETGGPDAAEKP